jgi:hypothetical protein
MTKRYKNSDKASRMERFRIDLRRTVGYKRYICCVERYRKDLAAFRGACISCLAICGITDLM